MTQEKHSSTSYDIFISYSHRDRLFANKLCKAFDDQGISYYIDNKNQKRQDQLPKELVDAITSSRTFLFMASHNSYESPFAVKELIFAFNCFSTDQIIIYKIDDHPIPANIDFVTNNNNIVESQDKFVRKELITLLCKLLQRDIQEVNWHAYEEIEKWDFYFVLWEVFTLLCLCIPVGIGLWFHSLIMGIGTGIGMIGVWFTTLFWDTSDFLHKTQAGKIAYLLTYFLVIIGSLMIPVSTWIGIQRQSWGTGLLWALCSWVAAILLMIIVNNVTRHIAVRWAPLTIKRKWGRI